jgi:hypothetical protein
LISESLDGFSVAATLQKAGRSVNAGLGRAVGAAPGGANVPAGVLRASVIVASGSAREARLSQVASPPGAASSVATETPGTADSADRADRALTRNPAARKYFIDKMGPLSSGGCRRLSEHITRRRPGDERVRIGL